MRYNEIAILKEMYDVPNKTFSDILTELDPDSGYNELTYQYRTTWEMCQLLDNKYLHSSRRRIDDFVREAKKNGWIK